MGNKKQEQVINKYSKEEMTKTIFLLVQIYGQENKENNSIACRNF